MKTTNLHSAVALAAFMALGCSGALAQQTMPAAPSPPSPGAPPQTAPAVPTPPSPQTQTAPGATPAAPGSGAASKAKPGSDAQITNQVEAALAATKSINSKDIAVATSGGVVTLTGDIPSKDQEKKAEAAAQSVPGVKKVDASGLKVGAKN